MSTAAWTAVVQGALLGTERASPRAPDGLPDAVAALASRLPAGAADDAEGALLGTAALLGAWAAAGRLPSAAGEPAVPGPADDADLPVAPAGAARLLATMLAGVHTEALPEWLARCAARGWRVPPLALPSLLALATTDAALRAALRPVLGARGRWLAAQHDDWRWAARDDALPADDAALAEAWQTGAPAERAELLEQVRRVDAERGRLLLEGTWGEEPPAQRAALVQRLRAGLGAADEPFLERALDDRRQEVRRAAAALLAAVPGSALVARMTARAQAALRHEPGGLLRRARLHVEPPAAHDAAMARDGIEKAPPTGMGERAWWLAQILAAVPPATWSAAWRAEPAAILRLADGGDWTAPLLEGWGAAAVRHRDAAWAEALLVHVWPDTPPSRLAPSRAELLAVLPADRRERLVADEVRAHAHHADVVELVLGCAHAGAHPGAHPWSEPFARTVLHWLRERAARPVDAVDAGDWRLRESLPRLALHVPPTLAGAAAGGWPADEARLRHWGRPVERFVALLTFRHEIAEELAR